MKPMTWAQRRAIERKYFEALQKVSETPLTEGSGIYVFTRTDEAGIRHAYVGQAKNIARRLVQHCMGYKDYIDLSLRKHKFWTEFSPYGYKIAMIHYVPERCLNEMERLYIKAYADDGFQLLNKTSGGQDGGKVGIAPNAPTKGYRDGLKQGYENARKFLAPLFEKYLTVEIKGAPNKIKERAKEKFFAFLGGERDEE